MSTIQDALDANNATNESLKAIDLKLDKVKEKIDALTVGQPVTQTQLDDLVASLAATKTKSDEVLDEATGLATP